MNKKTSTKHKILQASWQLFNEQGFAQTTTRQISQLAGVATGTVFSHFPTKLDILKTAMHDKIEDTLAQAAQSEKLHTPRLRLRHYAKFLYQFYLSNREFSKELIGGILWQHDYFSKQLEAFKHTLFEGQPYDSYKADIMMDCYFMTLIVGLNDEHSDVDSLVRLLSNKLQSIQ
ncbi:MULTISPECIES: TetR/AcrR family transcriptional regulator [Pseudoalteromonas]|uniref:TetR family transcriptional regulator n=1 Tax=Pseudoalteromonas amylolytica TaxID=1859457 RepID=A0A1S1MSN4_9GAMM|nr:MULTISPECIES: TetR/AcrR family transcriptional regulator [Pseudoalteromonas]MCF6433908.1 TetR/AcrR family transcriptional regulator [Pseudoalteromonas sp. MMG022]OHU88170.1 TetR family transcriptional regulator [Pseudoalteromonas sp. JW3]OHU91610.1 TetR family transcriptional regulator [Pseudoalteromonas amylolytica]